MTTRFATTPLMSMHTIAFAVTDFKYRNNAEDSKLPMRVLATSTNYEKTAFPLAEGEKLMKALENYLQVPYALPKIDQIFISNASEVVAKTVDVDYFFWTDFPYFMDEDEIEKERREEHEIRHELYDFPKDRIFISNVSEGTSIWQLD